MRDPTRWTSERRAIVGLIGVAVALAAYRAVALWGIDTTVAIDEVGYIANARHLAGGYPQVLLTGTFYSVGASLPLVPIAALTSSPTTLHVAGVMLNVVLASWLILLLYRLLRTSFAASPAAAFAGATVAGAIPWVTSNAATLWSETLLVVVTVLWLSAVGRLRPGHPWWAPALLAAWSVALYAVHVRAIGILVVGLVLIVATAARGRIRRRAAAGALAVAAAGLLATRMLNQAIADASYLSAQSAVSDSLVERFQWSDVGSYLDSAIGQSWGVLVSTFGLALPGLWYLAGRSWHGRTHLLRRADGRLDLLRASDGFDPLTAVAALACLAWFAAVSTVQVGTGIARLSRGIVESGRADLLVYTRYVEPVVLVVVAVGVVWIVDARVRTRERIVVAGSTVAVLAGLTLWIRAAFPLAWFDSFFSPSNASVVYAWVQWVGTFSPLRIFLLVAPLTAAAIALPTVGRRLGLVAVVIVSLALTDIGVETHLRLFRDHARANHAVATAVNATGESEVGFLAPWEGAAFYTYQFWLTDATYVLVRDGEVPADLGLVIGPVEWAGAIEVGAVRLAADPDLATALWRLPP